MLSDRQLVSSALQGDQAAFATLVGRYQRAARAAAFHRLGDHHAAEDAAQDAFVAAYRKLTSLRDGSLFGSWLLTIVRHQAERIGAGGGPPCPWTKRSTWPSPKGRSSTTIPSSCWQP